MAAITLIPKQTAAVTTPVVASLESPQSLPATLVAVGLGSMENATVSFSEDDGTTKTAASQDGVAVVLTATNNVIKISSPITISVVKSSTSAAAGVFLFSPVKQIS